MKKLAILCISFLLLSACSSEKELTKYSKQIFDAGFDTVIQLVAYTENEKKFDKYLNLMKDSFYRYHQLFDQYHTYDGINNVKTINDNAGKQPIVVDQELIDLLLETKKYYELSGKQYDISSGAVLRIWHNYRELALENGNPKLPSMQELTQAKQHIGWDKIQIDDEKNTVYLTDAQASIDLGSAAKGYAAEKVAIKLQNAGLKHGILNAGGNIRLIGEKPNQELWSVGIQIPNNEASESLATVTIGSDFSFVTSGDYQRFYEVNGKKYHHIIDPSTLMPANHMRSVTCITKDSTLADILSTTLFTLSYEDGTQLLQHLKQQGIDVEAVWVFDKDNKIQAENMLEGNKDFTIVYTSGLKDSIKISN